MTNSITVQENNQWFDAKTVASHLGITPQRANSLMWQYKDQLYPDIKIDGRRKFLTKDGIVSLTMFRNNTGKKTKRTVTVQTIKKNVVDRAKNSKSVEHLFEVVQNLSKEVAELKQQKLMGQQASELSLELLPEPTREVPEMNLRASLNKFIRDVAQKQNRYFQIVFTELYSQFYYRHGINIVARAKRKNMSMIEYAEEYNHLDDLYSLARRIYN